MLPEQHASLRDARSAEWFVDIIIYISIASFQNTSKASRLGMLTCMRKASLECARDRQRFWQQKQCAIPVNDLDYLIVKTMRSDGFKARNTPLCWGSDRLGLMSQVHRARKRKQILSHVLLHVQRNAMAKIETRVSCNNIVMKCLKHTQVEL